MNVGKIARLFQALEAPAQQTQKINQNSQTEAATSAPSTGAVKVADDFGTGQGADRSERAEKVKRLTDLVQSGQYKPDSKAVAIAVARDLFI